MRKKRLVPTTTYRLDDFLQAATRLNIEVILASNRCRVLAAEWPEHFGLSLPFSVQREAVAKAIAALRDKTIDAVVAADDYTTILAALLRDREFFQMRRAAAKRILVESYIPGSEVAGEGLLTNGKLRVLALFDKPDPLEGPFFEETIYVTPSRLPHGTQ